MFKYKFYSESFRISKSTDAKLFLRIICEYWGLDLKKFTFFDDNGEHIEMDTLVANSGGNLSIDQLVNSCMSKELKNKELMPKGPRQVTLYVGEHIYSKNGKQGFEDKFKKFIACKEKKLIKVKENIEAGK